MTRLIIILACSFQLLAATVKVGNVQVATQSDFSSATNTIISSLRDYDVRWAGATGLGVADDTSAFTAAKEATSVGGVVLVGPGTYILDGLVIDKDISFDVHPKAVLKHKANATGPMIQFTTPPTGFFKGGILDGNMANQTNGTNSLGEGTNWFSTLKINSGSSPYRFMVFGTVFTNFVFSGLQQANSVGDLKVLYCKFLDGKEHGGSLGLQSSGILLSTYVQHTTSTVEVAGCEIGQSGLPSDFGTSSSSAPGGPIFSGGLTNNNADAWVTVNFHDNIVYRVGQTKAGNHIGALDFYSGIKNSIVRNNYFTDCLYVPGKFQSYSGIIVEDNYYTSSLGNDGLGATSFVIWADPYERQDTGTINPGTTIIRNNIVNGYVAEPGIYVSSILAPIPGGVQVIGNTITNCLDGIQIANVGGNTVVAYNKVYQVNGGGSSAAFSYGQPTFQTNQGYLTIIGNSFVSTNATGTTIGGTNVSVIDIGNYYEASGAGTTAHTARGVLFYDSAHNRFNGINSATAGSIQKDAAANNVRNLNWDFDSNIVIAGAYTHTVADIDRWYGTVVGGSAPDGLFPAFPGTVYRRTASDNVAIYIKSGGTSTTPWRKLEVNNSVQVSTTSTVSSGYDHYRADTTSSGFTLSLPATPEGGQRLTVTKIVAANILTISRNGKTINGASSDITLTNQWDSYQLVYDNVTWNIVSKLYN